MTDFGPENQLRLLTLEYYRSLQEGFLRQELVVLHNDAAADGGAVYENINSWLLLVIDLTRLDYDEKILFYLNSQSIFPVDSNWLGIFPEIQEASLNDNLI
jgi:hypothetical protein